MKNSGCQKKIFFHNGSIFDNIFQNLHQVYIGNPLNNVLFFITFFSFMMIKSLNNSMFISANTQTGSRSSGASRWAKVYAGYAWATQAACRQLQPQHAPLRLQEFHPLETWALRSRTEESNSQLLCVAYQG